MTIEKFTSKLLTVYLLSTLLLFTGVGVLLNLQWNASIKTAEKIAIKDLNIASSITQQIILNGSKLIDITNRDLRQLIVNNNYKPEPIQSLLSSATSMFSLHNEIEKYGLLMVIDSNGNLIARSDGNNAGNLNFQDRYYFQDLKNNPEKTFSIGPLISARTTNKSIFHFAEPIKGPKGEFEGALVLQINEFLINEVINEAVADLDVYIIALTENNEVVFSTIPDKLLPNSDTAINISDLFDGINIDSNKQWDQQGHLFIAHQHSTALNLRYVAIQSTSNILSNFIKLNHQVLVVTLFGFLIFSYLMWFIYRQYAEGENQRLLSATDELTRLPNRRAFDERYEQLLRDSQRMHSQMSVLFIDIDKFKDCNDQYGHENGDLVLKSLALTLQRCMRRPLDFACRWGGEELVILLPKTNQEGAIIVAKDILNTVRNTAISINGFPPIFITVSIGIACADYHSNLAHHNNLVDRADQAMYRAKQAGRDRYSL